MTKFCVPDEIANAVSQHTYTRWLSRKAAAHVRRDRRRGNSEASVASYKAAIHNAVCECTGCDAYSGERLDWSLLSRYENEISRREGRAYKRRFALLPTVDHVSDGLGAADFKICSWRINDAKNDLSYEEFVEVCRRVVVVADGPS